MKKYFHEISSFQNLIIVPAPAKKFGDHDHAYLFAEGLSHALGATLLPCLKKHSLKSQRGSGRGERALLEMEIVENISKDVDFSPNTLWIFVDDILTTGATARAAHKALGSPQNFEIWTLAYRSLSCGASKDLL
ncbi:MAG: ComF family protein [Bdellovibrio sp.]